MKNQYWLGNREVRKNPKLFYECGALPIEATVAMKQISQINVPHAILESVTSVDITNPVLSFFAKKE